MDAIKFSNLIHDMDMVLGMVADKVEETVYEKVEGMVVDKVEETVYEKEVGMVVDTVEEMVQTKVFYDNNV